MWFRVICWCKKINLNFVFEILFLEEYIDNSIGLEFFFCLIMLFVWENLFGNDFINCGYSIRINL